MVVVVCLVAACGKTRPADQTWPAQIVTLRNFTAEERALVEDAVSDLNARLGHRVVVLNGNETAGYPLTLERVAPTAENKSRAGYAISESEKCTIQLSSDIFKPEKAGTIKPVVWHELYHCAGGDHVKTPGEIMSEKTQDLDKFTPEALQRFYDQFLEAVGLHS